jgi:hypothetical protein
MDEWGTGASVEGMVCVEVLPKTLVALAQEAAVVVAAGKSSVRW